MKHKLRWECASRTAYLDGNYLSPKKSQNVWNHSPDGFEIGYNGSGPSQLALAILLEICDKGIAISQYKKFRSDVIAILPKGKDCEIEFEF
jgi:hypothetical protein